MLQQTQQAIQYRCQIATEAAHAVAHTAEAEVTKEAAQQAAQVTATQVTMNSARFGIITATRSPGRMRELR